MNAASSTSATEVTTPIVIGVDDEPQSLLALRWAALEAASTGRPLRLVHAIDRLGRMSLADEMRLPNAADEIERDIEAHAHDIAAAAEGLVREAAPGVSVLTRVEDGTPYEVLNRAAKGAAMLVLGSHGRGLLGRMLLGSVSTAIGAEPPCPVAVIRAHAPAAADPDAPVVVGVDGTPSSLAALRLAADHALRHGVWLVALHCHREVRHPAAGTLDQQLHKRAAWLQGLVTTTEKRYPGLQITCAVSADKPAQALVERSAGARLVVVGTDGRPARSGSVGQALLHHSWSPVLIVPES
ncbi:universal stress protein [Actinorhabdospora filicis]|uniref:Universal stress protein n=1 Tax=Actinorhabdospora filicis TaxID=1785913 RepID=A0A9W6SLQ0_9ACTN|nr:universal stress protein [Actinorhabdospora filicis]GLZ78092.1 universal stress protein [Actinorhabdospora filicis]